MEGCDAALQQWTSSLLQLRPPFIEHSTNPLTNKSVSVSRVCVIEMIERRDAADGRHT